MKFRIDGRNVCLMCGTRTDEPFCEGQGEKPHRKVRTCMRWTEDWLERIRDEAEIARFDRRLNREA